MRNITLSADERLIAGAREKARDEQTTLNEQFRRWLEDYVGRQERVDRAMRMLDELREKIQLQGPFTRDEMNAR